MMGPDATRRGFLTLGLMSAGLGMLGLAGCSTSPTPQIFSLAIQPGTELETGPATLAVASAAIPKYLDRPQIVSVAPTAIDGGPSVGSGARRI